MVHVHPNDLQSDSYQLLIPVLSSPLCQPNLMWYVHFRMLEFVVKIGSTEFKHVRCTQPSSPNEGIIVDFSIDNEITWQPLKIIEPRLYNGSKERVVLELPPEAKTERTVFRWWQPLGYGGQFALDSC